MRRIMGGLALVAGLAAGGLVGGPAGAAPASAAEPAPALGLTAEPVDATVRPGDPVRLRLVVTNATGAACDLVTRPDSALQIVSATRDGQPVAPTFARLYTLDGGTAALARSALSTAPGETAEITAERLEAVSLLRGGSGVAAEFPATEEGSYEVRLVYEVPPAAGENACAGRSDVVSVAFDVGESRSVLWLVVTVGVLVVVAGLAVVLLSWRRRRRPGRPAEVAATVLLALVASAGLVAVDARPASANVQFNPDPGDPSSQTVYDSCWPSIISFDPGLVARLGGPDVRVLIQAGPFGESSSRHGDANGQKTTVVTWDPHDQTPFKNEPGVANNPCAALYHELVHGLDNANDTSTDERCGSSPVLFDEVRAVAAENRFRDRLGAPRRHTYDGHPIPPSEEDCLPSRTPRDQRRADNGVGGTCRALDGGCGSTNGDPHLVTYDGRFYDFHGAGEFVATSATAGDLEVQVRQAPFLDSRTVAVNTAIALRVGPSRIGFFVSGAGLAVHRDGQPVAVPVGQTALPGGATLTRGRDPVAGDAYDVTWADGSTASVVRLGSWGLRLSMLLAPGRAGTVTGLLGDFDGDPTDDPSPRGGAPLGEDLRYEALYPAFADSWRVTEETSLFDYEPGQSTATFTDRAFPDRIVQAADLPADQADRARKVCGWLGVTHRALLDACTLDLVVTGLATFAQSSADVQQQAPPGEFGVDGDAVTAAVPAGGVARVTFAGTAGTRVYVMAESSTIADQCGVLFLRGPEDALLATGCLVGGTGQIDGTILPTTGTYTIVVDPAGDAGGSVRLRVVSSVDSQGTITVDGPPVEVAVVHAGQTAVLTFDGRAGQKVFVDVPSSTFPDQCGLPLLKGPQGTIASGCAIGGNGFIDGTVLTTTGEHSVVIDPAETGTGRATVRLIGVTDQEQAIALGGEAMATVSQPGGVARLSFTLTTATTVRVEVLSSTLPNQCGVPTLADREGRTLASGCSFDGSGGVDPILLQPGPYTVEVNPAERQVGQVRLRVVAG